MKDLGIEDSIVSQDIFI